MGLPITEGFREVKVASVDDVLNNWAVQQDYVLIEDFGSPETYVGSIILLSGMKRNFPIRFGKVLKTGPGRVLYSKKLKKRVREKLSVKPGDLIMYWKLHGSHSSYETEDGLVLRFLDHRNQIQAVILEPPDEMESLEEYEAWLRKKSHPGWKMQL